MIRIWGLGLILVLILGGGSTYAQAAEEAIEPRALLAPLLERQALPLSAKGKCRHYFMDADGEPIDGDIAYTDFTLLRNETKIRVAGKTGGWAGAKPQVFERSYDGIQFRTYHASIDAEYEDVDMEVRPAGRGAVESINGYQYTFSMPQYGAWLHGIIPGSQSNVIARLSKERRERFSVEESGADIALNASTPYGEYRFTFAREGKSIKLTGMSGLVDGERHPDAKLPKEVAKREFEVSSLEYNTADGKLFPEAGQLLTTEQYANGRSGKVLFECSFTGMEKPGEIPDSAFDLAFPAGTKVWNRDEEQMYRVEDDGSFTPTTSEF